MVALGIAHPWQHLSHRAHVDAGAAEGLFYQTLGRRDTCPGLSREEQDAEPQRARLDALPARRLGQVKAVRRRPVECRRPQVARPLHRHERLAGHTGTEGKHRGAESFAAFQGAPRSDIQTEEGANHDAVVRTQTATPHDPRMCLPDALPIVSAYAEHGRATSRPARPMHARDLARRDAEVVAKWRIVRVARAKLRFLDDRKLRQVVKRPKRRRRNTGLLPLAPVKRTVIPRVPHLMPELVKYDFIAQLRTGTFNVGQPVILRVR